MCFSLFGFPNSGLVRQPDKLFTRTLKEDESLSSFLYILFLFFYFFFLVSLCVCPCPTFPFLLETFFSPGQKSMCCHFLWLFAASYHVWRQRNAVSDRGRPRSPYFLFHTLFFFLFLLRFLETLRQAASTNSSSSFSFFLTVYSCIEVSPFGWALCTPRICISQPSPNYAYTTGGPTAGREPTRDMYIRHVNAHPIHIYRGLRTRLDPPLTADDAPVGSN